MYRNIAKKSYILGISMGICISILIFTTLAIFGKISIFDYEKENLIKENISLKSQLIESNEDIKNLNTKILNFEKDLKQNTLKDKKANSKDNIVVLEISPDMTNMDIAQLIVDNGIYMHKNDILMAMEIINFDRYEYSKVLNDNGYITNAYVFNNILKEIEKNQSGVAEVLLLNNLVKDKSAFMKILYLFDMKNNMRYGKKEFVKNSSLRQLCDTLIK